MSDRWSHRSIRPEARAATAVEGDRPPADRALSSVDWGPVSRSGPELVPPLAERIAFLRTWARLLKSHQETLVEAVHQEIGKHPFETLTSDVMPLLASLRWHVRHARRLLAPRPLRGGAWWQVGQRHRVERAPVGRVAIIATWNYPIQLLGIQLAQAVTAGNEVVVKPSERCERTQTLLLRLALQAAEESGLPASTLSVRPATRDEGARLLAEERFDHVVFTGSTSVGRIIASLAAARLTPTTLELSGHDSAFVLDDANVPLAARSIWHAVTMNAGQTCMAPRRALVDQRVYAAFLASLAKLAAAARPVRLVDAAAVSRCRTLALDAVERGGRSLSGTVEPVDDPFVGEQSGSRMRPLAIADCPPDTALFEGDHFGPVLAVTPVSDLVHALSLHDAIGQSLATSVFTRDPRRIDPSIARFGSSVVTINDCVLPTAHPASSISGRGLSGWGASRGTAGLLALTREVTVSVTGRWRVPTELPEERVQRWMARFVAFPHARRPDRVPVTTSPPSPLPEGERA